MGLTLDVAQHLVSPRHLQLAFGLCRDGEFAMGVVAAGVRLMIVDGFVPASPLLLAITVPTRPITAAMTVAAAAIKAIQRFLLIPLLLW